jgi:hypothetical protein
MQIFLNTLYCFHLHLFLQYINLVVIFSDVTPVQFFLSSFLPSFLPFFLSFFLSFPQPTETTTQHIYMRVHTPYNKYLTSTSYIQFNLTIRI